MLAASSLWPGWAQTLTGCHGLKQSTLSRTDHTEGCHGRKQSTWSIADHSGRCHGLKQSTLSRTDHSGGCERTIGALHCLQAEDDDYWLLVNWRSEVVACSYETTVSVLVCHSLTVMMIVTCGQGVPGSQETARGEESAGQVTERTTRRELDQSRHNIICSSVSASSSLAGQMSSFHKSLLQSVAWGWC